MEPSQHGARQRPAGHAGRVLCRRGRAARPDRRDGAGAKDPGFRQRHREDGKLLRRGRAAGDPARGQGRPQVRWTRSSSPSSWWSRSIPARSASRRPAWWRSTRPRARCGPTTRWPCSRRRTLTANQRRTFQALREFLARPETQQAGPEGGLPAGRSEHPARPAPARPSRRRTASIRRSRRRRCSCRRADVVAVVQNVWALAKRKTNVVLVVDTSGSMQGNKLDNMQAALRTFLAQIPSDQEQVGLVEFNSGVANIIELDTLAKNRAALNETIDGLQAGGNTALLRRRRHRLQAAAAARRPGAHQRDRGHDRWAGKRLARSRSSSWSSEIRAGQPDRCR